MLNKKRILAAALIASAAMVPVAADAWWGFPFGGGPWSGWGGPWGGAPWGGYPGYGWGYPGYGWGYPGYGYGYPAYGYGYGYPAYGYPYYTAPATTSSKE
ncbi:MAG: hypothetical protein KDI27_03920 [Gammaproteobacteria bacterium]|nr:hypothetical protein [Gammaproteobacteria bacterium]MCP5417960.1 hypothetical protein [Chromatiaceae bacterium]